MRIARWPIVLGVTLLLFACTSRVGEVRSGDVHPWLLESGRDHATDELPDDYPYEVEVDGGSVVYDRGPTPAGFPWIVVYRHANGAVEILELDDDGEVQQRTHGTIDEGPSG